MKNFTPILDAVAAAPDHHRLIFEDERVRVLEACIKPGETTPLHTHRWPSAVYVISSDDFVRYDQEGTVVTDSRVLGIRSEAGSVVWLPPLEPHSVQNIGEQEARAIVFEIKN